MAYDVIVIGAGPAGQEAAVFTSRARLKTLLIGDSMKSQLALATVVGNHWATEEISGPELLKRGINQIRKYGGETVKAEVVDVVQKDDVFVIKTDEGKEYEGKKIIITSGTSYKLSGIENEEVLQGKGIHYCVACDGYFYKEKNVAVIGNGNYAAEEALELLNLTKNVTIISNGQEFAFSPVMKAAVDKSGIKLSKDEIAEFVGQNKFDHMKTVDGRELKFDGVFVAVGVTSALSFAYKLGLIMDEKNNVIIDRDGKTNIKGAYAAGGCTGGNIQIAKSIGEGCNAAIAIIKEVSGVSYYVDH